MNRLFDLLKSIGYGILGGVIAGVLFSAISILVDAKELQNKDVFKYFADHTALIRRQDAGGGTGFAIKAASGKTFTLTAGHVCQTSQEMWVERGQAQQELKVLTTDFNKDLCVLSGMKGIEGMPLAKKVYEGEQIYTAGWAGLAAFNPQAAILSFKQQVKKNDTIAFNYTAAMNIAPGNSGGAVINVDGEVIGVVVGKIMYYEESSGVGAIVPLDDLREVLSRY